ncbi:MAG: hypothetical protein Q9160_007504 [Pyrenula sp. 1 TL-2023]
MSEVQRHGAAPPRVFTPRSAANLVEMRKHKVVVETVTQEKKKLRSVLTFKAQAPLGYTFIPAGNPQLTNALKEAARQENEKIFAVSTTPHQNVHDLSQQVHRIGFHFPNRIIDMVCLKYGIKISSKGTLVDGYGSVPPRVQPTSSAKAHGRTIPEGSEDQITINTKARESITDLFPNIPDEDLWKIIKTAFQKGQRKVGTANELPLVRRAQLAVVAHIRHVYTDYDKLLRRGGYHTARTRVEKPTLEKLVAWRGDDENGSKLMEDVLKEVVVISDGESSEDEELDSAVKLRKQDAGMDVVSSEDDDVRVVQINPVNAGQIYTLDDSDRSFSDDQTAPVTRIKPISKTYGESLRSREQRRGFERYRHMAWNTAREHYRADPTQYTRSIASSPRPEAQRISPPRYIDAQKNYVANSPQSKLVSVSGRAGLDNPQVVLPSAERNHHIEKLARKEHRDHPELVRLADGFLYERVPRPVLVRPGRSITPELPASPVSRRRPMLEPILPKHVQSTTRLTSTNGVSERTRHDPEMVIPSIERDQTPDPTLPRHDGFARPYQTTSQDVVHGTSQVPAPRRPVERLSDRIELIRLDGTPAGSKRRLDDAFAAEDSQVQPRKVHRSDTGHSVPTRMLPGGDDALIGRSFQRQPEGKVTNNTSEVYRRQEFQGPPRLLHQAVPARNIQDTSVRFAADSYVPNSDVMARSSGPNGSHPADRYYIERSPERSVRIDKHPYSETFLLKQAVPG